VGPTALGYHEEAGAVGGIVLDAAPEHGHVIGAAASSEATAATVGSSLARSAAAVVGGHLLQASLRQVRAATGAFARGLRVRAHDLDLLELFGPGEEMLADVEGELPVITASDSMSRSRVMLTGPSVEFSTGTTPHSARPRSTSSKMSAMLRSGISWAEVPKRRMGRHVGEGSRGPR